MVNPLISVIVPCYKVECYLNQCVNSIVTQTYTNLEIILVDDGSPDRVPEMCDEWAKKDSRIKVIHKKNGGLSDARNAGLNICTGDFVAFVDSDDWIEPSMYEELYDLYKKKKADVCVCCGRLYFEKEKKFHYPNGFHIKQTYCSDEFLREMLLRRVGCASWDKLYTKEFISDYRFKFGRNNEDILWLFYCFYNREFSIAYINSCLYNYRKAGNSITTSNLNPHSFDAFRNCIDMEVYDNNNDKKVLREIRFYKTRVAISEFWQVYKTNGKLQYYEQYLQITKHLKSSFVYILLSCKFTLKEKIKSMFVLLY